MKHSSFTRGISPYPRVLSKLTLTAILMGISTVTLLPAVAEEEEKTIKKENRELEVVVVTARRRKESLQESPIAITAFTAAKLQESGITNLADLDRMVPNVDVGEGNGAAGGANIFIRGVGQLNTEPHLDSGVATYIDGVYVGRSDGALLDINDIQKVEVLRGPQGTLFGKNATGGALVFLTNRPQPEYEGGLTLRAGNYNAKDAEGHINIPIIDGKLFSRLSAVSKKRDGYVHNVYDGKYYNDVDRLSAVWQTRWLVSDDLTVDFNANYGITAQASRLQKCIVVDEAIETAWQRIVSDSGVIASYNKSLIDICRESQNLGRYESASDLTGAYNAENQGFSTTVDWAIGDTLNFKSISAWRGTKAAQDDDVDSLPIPLLHRSNAAHAFAEPRETDQYSQELQLLGDAFNGKIQWVTGLYAFRETTRKGITANQVGPIQLLPPVDNQYFYTTYATELDVDNTAYSAFSQIDWTLADNWMLTTGLRYTTEKRKLTKSVFSVDEDTLTLNGATIEGYIGDAILILSEANAINYYHDYIPDPNNPPVSNETNKNAWTPMVSLKYQFPEGGIINRGNVFLTFSKGFRSGGLSEAPGNKLETFEPEEVNNIELGIKIDTWNNRLRVNTALFQMDYTNRQLTTIVFDYVNGIPAPATINAENSTISGIELETTLLPFDGLEITFNGTWNWGDIKKFDDVQVLADDPLSERQDHCIYEEIIIQPIKICDVDRSDEDLPRLTERSFLLAIQYFFETPMGTIIPRIQGSWKFDTNNCFDLSSCDSGIWYADKKTDISARLTWISPEEQWRVSAFGTNLTKEVYANGGTALVDALGYGGQAYSKPRMVGIETQFTF